MRRAGLRCWTRVLPGLFGPAALLLATPWPAAAQLRRDPSVQPIAEARAGDLLIGLGASYGARQSFPLSGLTGDLLSLGRITFAYAPAEALVIELRGDLQNVLHISGRDSSHVDLQDGVADGTTNDFGVGGDSGLSGGIRVEVKLPNSNETKGIGTNTTDVRLSVLGSYGAGDLRLTGDLGIAILEAPLENFEQNDVVVYSAELLYRPRGGSWRLGLGIDGRAATRDRVLVGTEDLGEVRGIAEYGSGAWVLDLEGAVGYAGTSPDWAVRGGVSFRPGS